MADQQFSLDEGSHAMDSWPIPWPLDEMLLAALSENVLQPLHLSSFLLRDDDPRVPALEERSAPAGEPVHFTSEGRAQVLHEGRDLLGIVGNDEEMEMIGEDRYSTDLNRVHTLSPPEEAEDQIVELRTGAEQKSSLNNPPGDGDECVFAGQPT